MSKHKKARNILKNSSEVTWGNKHNLHSNHIDEFIDKMDEINYFLNTNKRFISIKNFRLFLDELEKGYNNLKNRYKKEIESYSSKKR